MKSPQRIYMEPGQSFAVVVTALDNGGAEIEIAPAASTEERVARKAKEEADTIAQYEAIARAHR